MPPIYDIPEVRHLFSYHHHLSLCFSSDRVFDRRVFCNRDDDDYLYDHHIDDDDVDHLDDNLYDLDDGRLYLCVCLMRAGDPFFVICLGRFRGFVVGGCVISESIVSFW